jgi:hypothetical protein
MNPIWPLWNKTKTQQQKEQQKMFKHLEIEKHIAHDWWTLKK